MRKIALAVSYCLLLPSLCWSQAPPKLSPEVRAFVKEDAPVVALTHVRVIDGTGAVPRTDQTLVIANGKITGMGDAASTKIPEGAKVLDLKGYTVIPGLVGMHDHMYYPAPGGPPALYPEHAASFPRLYLAGGVTSIRTTGSVEPYSDLELKRAIDGGKMAGPKIHVTGPYLEGHGAFTLQMHQLKDAEDARRTVEFWIAQGVTSFKAYMNITPEELAAAVKAAHARGIKVTGHLCSIGFREAAALGIDDLEHGLVADTEFLPDKKPGECPNPAAANKALEFEREFVKQGGLLLAGLDPTGYGGVIAGFGDQREVELLVEAGFTPVEAIHIATSNGAEFLGELEKIGTLAVGKLADIVVVQGDPSANIKDIEKIEIVFKDGIGYDSAKLIESARGQVGLR